MSAFAAAAADSALDGWTIRAMTMNTALVTRTIGGVTILVGLMTRFGTLVAI